MQPQNRYDNAESNFKLLSLSCEFMIHEIIQNVNINLSLNVNMKCMNMLI